MPAPVSVHTVRTTCRVCAGSALERFLDLGESALANAFLSSPDQASAERRFPLSVHLCGDCGLVQLVDVIDPKVLFGHYLYVTGTSETIAAHNEGYADAVVGELGLGAADLVVEAASNDGSLLARFRARGVQVLGVEPARNLAERAQAAGIRTVARFFDQDSARDLAADHGRARAVIANNVLAHVDDPVGFLRGARELLAPGGRVVVEVPELAEMVARLEYDTVYHEHLCYFSVTALLRLAEEAGLRVVRVDHVPVHGGSVRVWSAAASEVDAHAPAVLAVAARERETGLTSAARLRRFAADIELQRDALLALLNDWRDQGLAVAGYGAPAKGNTLLQYCGVTPELLPYTVDRNPLKVGLLTPGQHLPVRPVEALAEHRPDRVLVLAWNFAQEIVRQQAPVLAAGARFFVPIPAPRELT